jgi:Protein of unknown function (DUF1573)
MRPIISFCFLLITTALIAQLADPIVFTEKTHDFGSVVEDGGNVDTEFTFINKSGRAIRILTVQPSCGCTTPQWTREPIEPGQSGVIKASFDPRGKIGYFNKSIAVTTDYDGTTINLAIKGNVETKSKSKDESDFDVVSGSLRTRVSTLNIGKIFINKENGPWSFDLLNDGKNVLTFDEVKSPTYIKVIVPKELKAGERGLLKLYYDVKIKNTYGFASDNIEIKTNDTETPVKSFSVFATVEEYFPPVTASILDAAPILSIENADIKFGDLQETAILQREVMISNKGKKELSIRALQPNCTCLTAVADLMVIKPGQSTKIKISFSAKGRPGIQNKSIAVYSNDPRNPVQRITLSGYVR